MKNEYDNTIEPIIAEAAEKRGFVAEIHRQFCRLAKKKITRQSIDCWLRADAANRTEPSYSNSVILFKAIHAARIKIATKELDKK